MSTTSSLQSDWFKDPEGELAVDVYQTDEAIIVQSAIAGILAGDIDISIANDLLTIRGKRKPMHDIPAEDYFWRECFWGSFSRSIILPVEVEEEKVDASLKNGVLTIRLLKKTNKN
jgi:HSP20 family protein